MTQVSTLSQLREWNTREKDDFVNLMKKHEVEGLTVVEEK